MQRAFYQAESGGIDRNRQLPPWVYYVAAFGLVVGGMFASYVSISFYLVSIRALQPDPEIQKILASAAVLFVLAEITAFGLAGLLPVERLRSARLRLIAIGTALVVFEIASIYTSQATIARLAETGAAAQTARIEQLQASIASQRQAAAGLRENAARQNESRHSWIRQGAAESLRDAIAVERSITPLAAELAKLQAAQRPTMADVVGEDGVMGLSFGTAVFCVILGLSAFGFAGMFVREGRNARPPLAPAGGDGGQPAPAPVQPPAPSSTSASNTAASNTAPRARRARKSMRPRIGGNVVAFPAASAADACAGASTVSTISSAEADSLGGAAESDTVLVGDRARGSAESGRVRVRASRAVPDGHKMDTGTEGASASRYRRVREGVMSGEIKPSVRAIQAAVGGGTLVARRYLQALLDEGVIGRAGQGYELAKGQIAA